LNFNGLRVTQVLLSIVTAFVTAVTVTNRVTLR
jgi:hypothetical protein